MKHVIIIILFSFIMFFTANVFALSIYTNISYHHDFHGFSGKIFNLEKNSKVTDEYRRGIKNAKSFPAEEAEASYLHYVAGLDTVTATSMAAGDNLGVTLINSEAEGNERSMKALIAQLGLEYDLPWFENWAVRTAFEFLWAFPVTYKNNGELYFLYTDPQEDSVITYEKKYTFEYEVRGYEWFSPVEVLYSLYKTNECNLSVTGGLGFGYSNIYGKVSQSETGSGAMDYIDVTNRYESYYWGILAGLQYKFKITSSMWLLTNLTAFYSFTGNVQATGTIYNKDTVANGTAAYATGGLYETGLEPLQKEGEGSSSGGAIKYEYMDYSWIRLYLGASYEF